MNCNYEKVSNKLNHIIKSRLNYNFDDYDKRILDINLFSKEIGFTATHLLYIFVDIEREFNIQIPESDIVEGKFNTFNNILDIILKQYNLKI